MNEEKMKPLEDEVESLTEEVENVENDPTENIEDDDVEIIKPIVEEEPKEEDEPLQLQLLRMKADFDNFRKRTLRERSEWIARANEDLFLEILPVLDHYEMGLKSAEDHQTDDSVTEGFRMVYNQLVDLLKKHGVTPIETAEAPFDPHHHEALTHMPSDLPAETIVQEVRRGYVLGEKLLRAAQVVVSSGPAEEKESE